MNYCKDCKHYQPWSLETIQICKNRDFTKNSPIYGPLLQPPHRVREKYPDECPGFEQREPKPKPKPKSWLQRLLS